MIVELLATAVLNVFGVLLETVSTVIGPTVLGDISDAAEAVGTFARSGFVGPGVLVLVVSITGQLVLQAIAFTVNMYKLVPGKLT